MSVDLNIELTKLLSLHEASIQLEHAVRETAARQADWRPFSPSRFIYSFFTFNSIYALDWAATTDALSPTPWPSREESAHPEESEQVKALVRFCVSTLGEDSVQLFQQALCGQLRLFGINDPASPLSGIRPSNETKRAKGLRMVLPGNLRALAQSRPQLSAEGLQASLIGALGYIQTVRNNVFHGSKTRIELGDQAQQTRLLIYTSILNATSALFFHAIERKVPDWDRVQADFVGEAGWA